MMMHFVWLLALSFSCIAQEPVGGVGAPAPVDNVGAPAPGHANQDTKDAERLRELEADLTVLRAEVTTMREYQDSLFSVVTWSTGGLLGVVIVLIGYNWFVGRHTTERELAQAKQELSDHTRRALAESVVAMDAKVEHATTAATRHADRAIAVIAEVEEKLTAKLAIMMDEKVLHNRAIVEGDLQRFRVDLSTNLQKLRVDLTTVAYEQLQREAKDRPTDLYVRTRLIRLSRGSGPDQEYRMHHALQLLLTTLEGYRTIKRAMDTDEVYEVSTAIQDVAAPHQVTVKAIEELMRELLVAKTQEA